MNERSGTLIYFFTGLADGLIVPFALLAGATAMDIEPGVITYYMSLIIPFAGLLMGGAGFFTSKDERTEQQASLDKQAASLRKFYNNLELGNEIEKEAAEDHLKEKQKWQEIAMHRPKQKPFSSFSIVLLCYVAAGFLSLAPFYFYDNSTDAFRVSAALTLTAQFITGAARSAFRGTNKLSGAITLLVTGFLAALAAYGIGWLLSI